MTHTLADIEIRGLVPEHDPEHLLFQTATDTLRDFFRTRLNLPDGRTLVPWFD